MYVLAKEKERECVCVGMFSKDFHRGEKKETYREEIGTREVDNTFS